MKAKTSLIGSQSRVELNPVTAVNLDCSLIVHPGDLKHNGPLRFHYPVKNACLDQIRPLFNHIVQTFKNFLYGLEEFRLVGISFFNIAKDTRQVCTFDGHKNSYKIKWDELVLKPGLVLKQAFGENCQFLINQAFMVYAIFSRVR
jgi:hypothetical protein